MALRLSPPIEKTFILENTDKLYGTEGTQITVRQASQGQHERRQDLFAEMTSRIAGEGGQIEIVQRFSLPELHRIEAMLTLTACNIEDEDGKPLFKFRESKNGQSYLGMTDLEFREAWNKLPVDVAEEIHSKVTEVNISWGPEGT